MSTEVSCVFRLEPSDNLVKQAEIGDGVSLQLIREQDWWLRLETDDSLVAAKEKLDWGTYTHRFFVSLVGRNCSEEQIEEAKQRILRAVVLSRIVHPTPIASGGLWLESDYSEPPEIRHLPEIGTGVYGRSYVSQPRRELTLTQNDADVMASLWGPMQKLFGEDGKYDRIIRALKYFDGGFHQWDPEFRHMIFHSALESLICTKHERNRKQVVTRLSALAPSITEDKARAIYDLCCTIKHSAGPLPSAPGTGYEFDQADREISDVVVSLERALRDLFQNILSDSGFADLLADPKALAQKYRV